ncbi:hypothetical protein ACIU1J_04285 [Azospirillum doebereinerae]|uniref:hypothetical protein n=1 Tax=Azospirillum doebereinerae TaxID=92933 RepID=UPI001EE634CD|nr:hypothetical protein [Azospirillum doebereinerae]MCG5242121.1 hypothetical protein [Azospirillum doebereinerae]
MATDQRKVPLDIRDTREQPDVDEREMGFQNVEGPGAEEDYGIPGSEEARALGTGPLPQRREDGRDRPQPEQVRDDRIVDDRNVAVDGGRDNKDR